MEEVLLKINEEKNRIRKKVEEQKFSLMEIQVAKVLVDSKIETLEWVEHIILTTPSEGIK